MLGGGPAILFVVFFCRGGLDIFPEFIKGIISFGVSHQQGNLRAEGLLIAVLVLPLSPKKVLRAKNLGM